MKKFITIFYDIRDEEWKPTLLMFGLHFLLMVILYFLKPARDSLFLHEIGPSQLPIVYILLAVASIPVTQFMTGLMSRYSIRTVLLWTLGFLAANLLGIRILFQIGSDWIFTLFYIWVGIFGILVISLFWLLANEVFGVAQSKRLFSFLTLGAILGAITGSEVSSLAVSMAGLTTQNLLYICAGLLLVCILILFAISPKKESSEDKLSNEQQRQSGSSIKAAKKLLSSPYQMGIAGIVSLTMIATTLTDYQFKVMAFDAFPETSGLTAFMGTFYAGVSLVSLVIQLLFSTQIIKRLGLAGAVLTRPAGMLLAAIALAVEPVLAAVILLNGFDLASRYSIDKTGRELLFLPLSKRTKEQTKLFIDIFVDRFSRGFGGVLLLGFIYLLDWPVYPITFVVIFVLTIWILLGIRARKGYVEKFRHSLKGMFIDIGSPALNLEESSIRRMIRESLLRSNDTQILHTLYLLKDVKVDKMADDLQQLLDHSNREIRLEALKLLQGVDNVDMMGKVQDLLKDPDPEIRLETIYYMCQHSEDDPSKVIRSYLEHEDDSLKAAAVGCASKHAGSDTQLVEPEMFDKLIHKTGDRAIVIKAQLADALGYIADESAAYQYLSELLNDPHPIVVRKTIDSMARQQNDRFIPKLLNKLKNHDHTIEIRKALASYGVTHLILYKDRFMDDRTDMTIRKKIPAIYAYIPDQQSADHLQEMLHVDSPDLRYHVIKSLNKVTRDHPELEINQPSIRDILKNEVKIYYDHLSIKQLQPADRPNQILLRALQEKMEQTVERIFRLLGLLYDPVDVYGTYLGLKSNNPNKHSAAIEFLDNVLTLEDRKLVFPIVDDRQEVQKLEAGREQFDLPTLRYDEGLHKLINGDDHWLKVCALYSVSPRCPEALQEEVREASGSANSLIRETAELVIRRNSA